MRSRPVDSIYEEVRSLGDSGVREINLIAQDMTSYGRDIGTNLTTLLRKLSTVDTVDWIRIHYCYPWGISDELIELLASENNILPYIDMPIQHINDRILKLMDRKTPAKRILSIINNLRENLPELTLRTTLIVGFPSETESDFNELVDFVREIRFDRLGAFKYSLEEGTSSFDLTDQVDDDIKIERLERLLDIQSDISLDKNRMLVGKQFNYFVEGEEDGDYIGRISTQAPEVDGNTYINKTGDFKAGEYLSVEITEADIYNLHAKVV